MRINCGRRCTRVALNTLNLMNMAHNNEHDEDIGVTVFLSEEASWIYHTHEGDNVGGTEVAVNLDGPNHFTRETENTNGTRQRPRAYGL